MKQRKRYPDALTAFLFISPAALLLGLFYVFPIFFSLISPDSLSFLKW